MSVLDTMDSILLLDIHIYFYFIVYILRCI